MSDAYVLMTAMPPTKGHAALIEFASLLPVGNVFVLVCTQPTEPFPFERYEALRLHFIDDRKVQVVHLHRYMEQNAEADGFWNMWRGIMLAHGFQKDDIVVSSEAYGQKVADLFGAKFVPYDPGRELLNIKATHVRKSPSNLFDSMIPEFQVHIRQTVTLFGAESVGKTTLSKHLAKIHSGRWVFEYARPYLEMVGAKVTDEKMHDIFNGQAAVQQQARYGNDKPFIVQDTDLYSTIGYWEMWKDGVAAPTEWYRRAAGLKSDLYIIPSQNIPFQPDILRYGGDQRESTDQYWVDLCEREGLNYVVIDGHGRFADRVIESSAHIKQLFYTNAAPLMDYERRHNG